MSRYSNNSVNANQNTKEKVDTKPATTPTTGSLPVTDKDGARKENAPRSFAMEKEFLKFLLVNGDKAFQGGGLSKGELKQLISQWNRQNSNSPLKFDDAAFTRMASRIGLSDKVNRDEIFISLGKGREERAFQNSKPFLNFLLTNAKEAQSDGGLTLEEVQRAAAVWNKMNFQKPMEWVTVSYDGFNKIALRDSSRSSRGEVTISLDELKYFAGVDTGSSTNSKLDGRLVSGDLKNWESRWPESLPFSYKDFQFALDQQLRAVKLRPGYTRVGKDHIPIRDAMSLVSEKTGVTSFSSSMTETGREQYQVNEMNPFRDKEQHYVKRNSQATVRARFLDIAVAAEELKRGRRLTEAERMHFERGYDADRAVAELASLPGNLYQKLTGLKREDAAYAYAALDFLGGFSATPGALAKQGILARQDLSIYLRDVFANAPENAVEILRSINVFDASAPPEERFGRSLNALAVLVGGATLLRGRLGPTKAAAMEIFARKKFSNLELRVLSRWIDEAQLFYASDSSGPGVQNSTHIQRQVDAISAQNSIKWFEANKKLGFNLDEARAAIVGTDLTKFHPTLTDSALNAGRSVPKLAPLRYVPEELQVTGSNTLPNLFAHSEGGMSITFTKLVELGKKEGLTPRQANNLAYRVAEHIVGHDSFRYGFGEDFLRPQTAAQTGIATERLLYPTSRTPSGFVVQLLDRVEATMPETQLRYVKERVTFRGSSIEEAIDGSIVTGYKWLREAYDGLLKDAKAILTPEQYRALLESPHNNELLIGLRRFEKSLELFRKNPDGSFDFNTGDKWIKLTDFETFEKYYIQSVKRYTAGIK